MPTNPLTLHPVQGRPQKALLIDTASLYFRAFFGVPDSVKAPDGTPVNAVRGLLDFVARLVTDCRPTHLACCWDNDWRPQWRVDLVPTYKQHRVVAEVPDGADVEETPDPLAVQVPVIEDVLQALGLAVVGADAHEADDVIGTLATGSGMPVDIVTGDRDLFQLVDDDEHVRVLYTARGMSNLECVDAEAVRAKYGIEPGQYADFATLRGDSSDGLPGVAGIGDKTAATLLQRFGDLDGVAAAAHDIRNGLTPAQRKRIVAGAGYLRVAPTVVAVVRDLELGSPDLRLPAAVPAVPAAFEALVERWGLGGSAERAVAALSSAG